MLLHAYQADMIIQQIEFLGSFKEVGQCPDDLRAEYAFWGRSNVGKSSVINYLMDRKSMAHVSSTPGKTQSLNLFDIDQTWRIMDLPGYGYARVSKKERSKWERMIEHYLLRRRQLAAVFLLMDFSIDTQRIDMEKAQWLAENEVPFYLLFTKVDRIRPAKRDAKLTGFITDFMESWSSMPPYFLSSSTERIGREDILKQIGEISDMFAQRAQ